MNTYLKTFILSALLVTFVAHPALAKTTYQTVPTGATAKCKDGTYSFSKNHKGTCSHHKGVLKWYK
ncbi:MAG: hypothetical protein RL094_785 [Candidatus Parcubacteria bacterium]|jgi:hypothetical protein